ncbi:MAG: hypothetical protein ACOH2K_03935 [Burkholderiaceae bacterium]
MTDETKDSKVKTNTAKPVRNDGKERLPHERDEAPDAQKIEPREVMKQAVEDLERGLVDTDLHGIRGVEKVVQTDNKSDNKPNTKSGNKVP